MNEKEKLFLTVYNSVYIMLTNKCGRNDGFKKSPFGIIVENLTSF